MIKWKKLNIPISLLLGITILTVSGCASTSPKAAATTDTETQNKDYIGG